MDNPSHPDDLGRTKYWTRAAVLDREQPLAGSARWTWDIVSGAVAWETFARPMFGPTEGSEPRSLNDLLDRIRLDCRDRVSSALRLAASDPETDFQLNFEILWEDGSIHVLGIAGRAKIDEGQRGHVVGVVWDLTNQVEAETQIRNAWLFLDSIVENNPNAIFVKRASDLSFVRFNRANEELLGIPKDRVIGKTDYDLFPKEEADYFTQMDREVLESGEMKVIPEEEVQTQHLGIRVLYTKKIPIVGEDGTPVYLLGISEDITERKRAEAAFFESQTQLQAILDNTTSVIYLKDTNFQYVTVNAQFEKLFGVSREGLVGKTDFDLFPDELASAFRANDQEVLSERLPIEVEEKAPIGGELRTYISIKFPICNDQGEAKLVGGISTDITMRKNAEEAIRKINDELESKVTERTKELSDANASLASSLEELKQRNEEIKRFYHTVSHELKTPLMSTREFIAIVADGIAGKVSAKQQEYLNIALKGCDQIKETVNDLIDTTRLETGRLEIMLQSTELPPVIQEVVQNFGPTARGQNVRLKSRIQAGIVPVWADCQRLNQVLSNLVSNALKHTPEGGRIDIEARLDPNNSSQVQVSVRDTGCGIAEEHQARIFDRLYQIKRDDLAVSGSLGLGLHICREIILLFHGEIWVESKVGEGTSFHFVIPVAA